MTTNYNKIIRAFTVAQSIDFVEPFIKKLQMNGFEIVTVSSDGPQLQTLRNLGVKTIVVDMYRRMSPFKDMRSLWQLIKVFCKEKPYMVHSMTPKAGMLCMLAAWITRVPKRVHTFTGLVWPTATGLTRKILMATDWVTCACATHVIPEGEGVKDDLQKFITQKQMKVLGFGNCKGVDMDFWRKQVHPNVNKENGMFYFTFVGRIVSDKGINELVEAFTKLYKKYSNIRLRLIGPFEDDLDPISQETRDRIVTNEAIEAVGSRSKIELVQYYSASDCFVFPSYREGFPNVLLEAGAMGLPSIVTNINGSREIIKDGVNGLIIQSKDVDALEKAMERMINDKDIYVKMAENARPMIESRFEQSFVQKCLLEFYRDVIE